MSVRRWAPRILNFGALPFRTLEDFVLAAVCAGAITLALWPADSTRQMIHCHDADGNASSYSMSLNDSRLARLRRDLDRREHPPASPAMVMAKWRTDLAGHYIDRCETKLRSDVPVVQVSFRQTPPPASTTNRELAFWKSVAERSESDIAAAKLRIQQQLAAHGPAPVVLGDVFTPPKSRTAWIASILLGLLTSCIFAEWKMRAPAIEIVRRELSESCHPALGAIRVEIPIAWMRIHQPKSVWVRRLALTTLVVTATALVVV